MKGNDTQLPADISFEQAQASLIKHLVRKHRNRRPSLRDVLTALDFDDWYLTAGPLLVGTMKDGRIFATGVRSICSSLSYARVADGGTIRLGRRATEAYAES